MSFVTEKVGKAALSGYPTANNLLIASGERGLHRMTYEELFENIARVLQPLQVGSDDGEDFREPPLEVMRYETRRVRLHWFPVLGGARAVVAVVRQPMDVKSDSKSYRELLSRVSRAVHGRYPPWPKGGPGFTIGLTTVVLTTDPIGPQDETFLASAMPDHRKSRIIPLGLFRINLDQEALSFVIGPTLDDVFPEPILLAEMFAQLLGRYVPPLDFD